MKTTHMFPSLFSLWVIDKLAFDMIILITKECAGNESRIGEQRGRI